MSFIFTWNRRAVPFSRLISRHAADHDRGRAETLLDILTCRVWTLPPPCVLRLCASQLGILPPTSLISVAGCTAPDRVVVCFCSLRRYLCHEDCIITCNCLRKRNAVRTLIKTRLIYPILEMLTRFRQILPAHARAVIKIVVHDKVARCSKASPNELKAILGSAYMLMLYVLNLAPFLVPRLGRFIVHINYRPLLI